MQYLDSVTQAYKIEGLRKLIDFKKELPENIFIEDSWEFWFFERPILVFQGLMVSLISHNLEIFKSNMYLKLCGDQLVSDSCFCLDGPDIEGDIRLLNTEFNDFFGGVADYPFIFFNEFYDWIAFESVYEEFGVMAVSKKTNSKEFTDYLNADFIPKNVFSAWALGSDTNSIIAKAFLQSY